MNYEDNATIRNAILKRLDTESCVIFDLQIKKEKDCIAVGVWAAILNAGPDIIDTRSFFDLKPEFTHKDLLNEIDEIAEQIKAVRKSAGPFAIFNPSQDPRREAVKGTGLRGRWGEDQALNG